jgi:hypothetical protein
LPPPRAQLLGVIALAQRPDRDGRFGRVGGEKQAGDRCKKIFEWFDHDALSAGLGRFVRNFMPQGADYDRGRL